MLPQINGGLRSSMSAASQSSSFSSELFDSFPSIDDGGSVPFVYDERIYRAFKKAHQIGAADRQRDEVKRALEDTRVTLSTAYMRAARLGGDASSALLENIEALSRLFFSRKSARCTRADGEETLASFQRCREELGRKILEEEYRCADIRAREIQIDFSEITRIFPENAADVMAFFGMNRYLIHELILTGLTQYKTKFYRRKPLFDVEFRLVNDQIQILLRNLHGLDGDTNKCETVVFTGPAIGGV